mgnify:CR=1 FL=1
MELKPVELYSCREKTWNLLEPTKNTETGGIQNRWNLNVASENQWTGSTGSGGGNDTLMTTRR